MPYKDKDKAKAYQLEWRKNRSMEMAKLKEKPCKDCGVRYPHYVMDFDHGNNEKLGLTFSRLSKGRWERLLAEVAKCDVICANCHRERTQKAKHYIPKKWR